MHLIYKAACFAHGLLEDDGEWNQCLEEAGVIQTGGQLHSLFAHILLLCHSAESVILWNHHKAKICGDLKHRLITHYRIPEPTNEQVYDFGLYLINQILLKSGKTLSDFPPMPIPQGPWNIQLNPNLLLQEQHDYDGDDLAFTVTENLQSFNPEQHAVYNAVIKSTFNNEGKTLFLPSAGGGGKTFVCNIIVAAVHSNGHIALTVASSAIAAFILNGGHTSHSHLKIPIPIHNTSTCRINKQSNLAAVLRQTKIIIWDEAPMQHCHGIEAID